MPEFRTRKTSDTQNTGGYYAPPLNIADGAKPPTPYIPMEKFFQDQNRCAIPIILTKWLFRSYQTTLVTGDQGSGKTTYLKSAIRFLDPSAAIRVNEIQPELNLRFTYPERNIISFAETGTTTTQDGLDFQKKTSGTVNIIGEIATAPASSWFIQTANVASKCGFGTNHAQDIPAIITYFAMNMIEVAGYNNQKAVEEMVADAIHFDIHMTRERGFRFNERITEINAVHNQPYPYDDLKKIKAGDRELAALYNREEYQKRITDRQTFEYHDISRYNREKKRYELVGWFSDKTFERMRTRLTEDDERTFLAEMDMIREINSKP